VTNTVAPQQETVLLFMTELAIYSLVTRANVALNQTHRFEPGPFGPPKGPGTDIYVYVRFNGGFTPSELISMNMIGWTVKEDVDRHTKWHGESVTWFDVLTNKISVDRSSVGNALYVVLNLAAGSVQEASRGLSKKNFADVESWVNVAPSFKKPVTTSFTGNFENSQYDNFGNQTMYANSMPLMPLGNQMPQGIYSNQMTQGMYSNQNPMEMQMPGQMNYYNSSNFQQQIYRPETGNPSSQMFTAQNQGVNPNFPTRDQYGNQYYRPQE
jgi:hypothetical protein